MGLEKRPHDRYGSRFVGVRIPNELHKALFDLSKEANKSASQLLVDALSDKLEKIGKMPEHKSS